MICQWCKTAIEFKDCGKPCPGITGAHRPDNRHAPLGEKCPCGRSPKDHRVSHQPKGDPCGSCGLPAASHITRASPNLAKTRQLLRARDGWKCTLCNEPFTEPSPRHPDPKSVEIDHIVPVWQGGTYSLDNLRLVHRICNMRRGGDGLSPAQQARDEKAIERWRGQLSVRASGMTAPEIKTAALSENLDSVTKKRSGTAQRSSKARSCGARLRCRSRS